MYLFHTPRLRIRRLSAYDLDALLDVYGDADAMRWVGDGAALTEADCARWVEVTERNYTQRGYGMSAIELAADGTVIGFCGLVHPSGQAEPELKYALRREHWGHGYATEAAANMLRYGAEAQSLRQIIATAAPENLASHNVLYKAGMQRITDRIEADGSATALFVWQSAD
ncbi:GNAT family N-acetyltransferase [Trinickia fusca]|uniref:N-acetyltransferase n=1 Tax=Trinickia fusca TaxID=2419777 RepID=A0A494XWQ8_9BURK|nr:GNAT family N-acetyltransferase [Trinickia fusca]RKP52539.1 N-acetyltransferase [Trinickia fusca]